VKIKKLQATYGKLNNEVIEFNPGLNVIHMPNESGKSTWCAFIRAMFFGVDSAERMREGHLPDKVKYEPWSGAPMQGSMDIEYKGNDITLIRSSEGKAGLMKNFKAVHEGTAIEVEGLTGTNAGEKILGVSPDVFRKSAFVEQGAMTVTNSPELEKRITAMVTSGDENISYSEVEDRLKTWKRARIYQGKGSVEILDNEINEKLRELSVLKELQSDLEDKKERLSQTEQKYKALEDEVVEGRKACRKDSLERLSSGKNMVASATSEYESALDKTETIEKEKSRNPLCSYDGEEARLKAEKDLQRCFELKSCTAKKPSALAGILMFILFLASFMAVINHLYFIAVSVALGIISLVLLLGYRKKNLLYVENLNELQNILREYDVDEAEQIEAVVDSYLEILMRLESSERLLQEKEYELENCRKTYNDIEASTLQNLDFSQGDNELSRLTQELSLVKEERNYLIKLVAQAEGRLSSLGNAEDLEKEIEKLEEKKNAGQMEFDSLNVAIDVLKESEIEIQTRFSPALAACASKYLSILTDGKYDKMVLNRDFSLLVGNCTESVMHKSEYLSAGTVDLVYLAVRLAVCKLTLPEEDKCPIILDDIFANFDEERTRRAINLLKEISKERQVILFSCKEIV